MLVLLVNFDRRARRTIPTAATIIAGTPNSGTLKLADTRKIGGRARASPVTEYSYCPLQCVFAPPFKAGEYPAHPAPTVVTIHPETPVPKERVTLLEELPVHGVDRVQTVDL